MNKYCIHKCVSTLSDKDPAPDDSTGLELKSGNNPFDEDTPPTG